MDKIFENMRVSASRKLVLAVDNLIRTDSSEIFVLIYPGSLYVNSLSIAAISYSAACVSMMDYSDNVLLSLLCQSSGLLIIQGQHLRSDRGEISDSTSGS